MAEIKKIELENGEIRWTFQVYVGVNPKTGKQSTTERRFKSHREAKRVLRQIELQVEEGTYFKERKINQKQTFEDVYKKWLEEYEHTVQQSTYLAIKRLFENRILPNLGKYKIDKITHDDVQKLANDWGEYKNCRMWIGYIRRTLRYAMKHDLIERNPAELVTIPIINDNSEDTEDAWDEEAKNFYERAELEQLMISLDKREDPQIKSMIRLLAFTGLRNGEALGLKWRYVDFEKRTISVRHSVARRETTEGSELYLKGPKNKASYRTISVDQKTLDILAELKQYAKTEFVFNSRSGGFLTTSKTRKWLISVAKGAGLEPIKVHGLRHTHASLCFESGASVKYVQKRLGHKKIETTLNIYTHVTEKTIEDFSEKFEDYFNF